MRRMAGFLTLLLLLAAAGCTGVVVQDYPDQRGSYFEGDFDYAAGNGAIETVVVGNPFGGPKEAFDDRVRSLMMHQNRGVPAEFVAGQSERTDPLYKVVTAFNLAPGVPNYAMCRNPAGLPSLHHAGQLDIAIAFCEGDEVKSYTTGYAPDVQSASDPKFAELVRYATLYMVPDRDPITDDSDGDSADPQP